MRKRSRHISDGLYGTAGISRIRTALAVAACKAARAALHLTGNGGTSLPGRIAAAIDKDILAETSRDMDIIVVTGTNGKTTTCHMLAEAFASSGKPCLTNHSGANLASGITAAFACDASLAGKPGKTYAVTECDEGALKLVVPSLHPKVIVVTNLFRDQLDRYGEVTHTLEEIRTGLKKAPEAVLCLNADCSLTASLAEDVPNPVLWYGLDVQPDGRESTELSDARYCIRCGTAYQYRWHTYAHLGSYYCPKCGYCRPPADVAVEKILKTTTEESEIILRIGERQEPVRIRLPAVYNLYNAAAAVCAWKASDMPEAEILKSLESVSSSFGRMERFILGEAVIRMILVKNPAGCGQALEYVTGTDSDYQLVFCLNDRTADGHDISWIWDADYETVIRDPHRRRILVTGDRAEDMQLRLKYAGAAEDEIRLEKNTESVIDWLRSQSGQVFVLPNYTAMLALRKALVRKAGGKEFWK